MLRRDFTVNGMAMNRFAEVIDLVGDVEISSIRHCEPLGNAQQRSKTHCDYLEHAVLWQKLDFLPTEDLLEAMPKAFHRVPGLSLERVL